MLPSTVCYIGFFFSGRKLPYISISVQLWNFKDGGSSKASFLAKNSYTQGNHCIFRIRGAPVCRKLGMILENKVAQKLKLEKNVFYKRWSPKLIFLNDFFLKK